MFASRLARPVLCVVLAAAIQACSSRVDIKEHVKLVETSGGWYDAGIVDGKNKIVPMVTFRLEKTPDADLDALSLNVVFRHPNAEGQTGEEEDWDEVFIQRAEFSEGNRTGPLVVRTGKGYTGDPPQSRLDLLQHSQFRDVRGHVYAKYSSAQWVHLGTIDVPRQLITR